MAYVRGFENDVFVSYAHVDNAALVPGVDGWVTTLVTNLETKLAQNVGRADTVRVWHDSGLEGNVPIEETLLDAVRKSALFIAVLSNGYLASPWCAGKEQGSFISIAGAQTRRLFVVHRSPVAREQQPAVFRNRKGYEFFERASPGRAAHTLGEPSPSPNDTKYWALLDRLAQEVADELVRMRKESAAGHRAPFDAAPGPAASFVPSPIEAPSTRWPRGPKTAVGLVLGLLALGSAWSIRQLASSRPRTSADSDASGVTLGASIVAPVPSNTETAHSMTLAVLPSLEPSASPPAGPPSFLVAPRAAKNSPLAYLRAAPSAERAPVASVATASPAAPAPLDCSKPCSEDGLCEARGTQCVAVSREACRQSANCGREGQCSKKGDVCVVGSNDDCAEPCKALGLCVVDFRTNRCMASSEQDCRNSTRCKVELTWCKFESGRCVP